jgi:hypothetical protein
LIELPEFDHSLLTIVATTVVIFPQRGGEDDSKHSTKVRYTSTNSKSLGGFADVPMQFQREWEWCLLATERRPQETH